MAKRPALRSDSERNALYELHADLVPYFLRICFPGASDADADDLLQAGRLGLLRACELYDATRRVKFSAFASRHILVQMYRERRLLGGPIRLPHRFDAEKRAEIFERLGLVSLDANATQAPGRTPNPGCLAQMRELRAALPLVLLLLPDRTRAIIEARLAGEGLREIGTRHGIHKERVRQVARQALGALRDLLADYRPGAA